MHTGRKGSGGLVVARMGAWITDVITMVLGLSLVLVIFAGAFF